MLKDYPKNASARPRRIRSSVETLCMKSLISYLMNKDKVKAEKEIKSALLLDAKNGTCWQTLGLFYRHAKCVSATILSGRNYAEARKAFSMASMRDTSNLQIVIDLAALHAQNRDFAGYRRCYQKLIGQLPGRSQFWMGMIVGYYMEKNYEKCIEAIKAFRDTLDKTPSYQRQELCFLETECLVHQNKTAEAIQCMKEGMVDILNEDKAKERLAVLYGKNHQYPQLSPLIVDWRRAAPCGRSWSAATRRTTCTSAGWSAAR